MNAIFEIAGFTRQAHWEYMQRLNTMEEKKEALILAVSAIREIHPGMGGKKLYYLLEPEFMGRDLFLDFLKENGLQIDRPRSKTKTTFSIRSHWFPNLIPWLELSNMDTLWTSDITYFRIGEKFFYITFVMDIYSRRILGWAVSPNLRAEANVIALEMALKLRGRTDYSNGLIHHSDQGVQYASVQYTEILLKHKIRISMSSNVKENSHVERVNGTIKNDYLIYWRIETFNQLSKAVKRSVDAYNNAPHWSLNFKSPMEWEKEIKATPANKRTLMKLYNSEAASNSKKPSNQLALFNT